MEDEYIPEKASIYCIKRIYMGGTEENEKLYELEEKRYQILKQCAEEWMRLNNIPKEDYYNVGLPTAIYDLLNSVDSRASKVACKQFLDDEGSDPNFKMPKV